MFTCIAVTDKRLSNRIVEQYSVFGGEYAVLQFLWRNRIYHKRRGYLVFD